MEYEGNYTAELYEMCVCRAMKWVAVCQIKTTQMKALQHLLNEYK